MDRKTLIIVIIIEAIIIVKLVCFPNKAKGSELVKDLSAYMTINPGESKQSREMKQEYNLNQYLNQRDARTQESYNHALNNFSRSIDNINYSGRTPTYQEIHRNCGGILDD